MPAFHEALIGGVRITYTIERDGTLLLALSDLAPSDPAAARALLARVAEAVGRRAHAAGGRARRAVDPRGRRGVGAPAVGALRRLGLHLPGPPVPTDPALVPALLLQGRQVGAGQPRRRGWRLDPSAITADGWSYAVDPPMLRPWRRT